MGLTHWFTGSPQRCDCPCHGNPAIQHIAACCKRCGKCGLGFSAGLEAHERECQGPPASPAR